MNKKWLILITLLLIQILILNHIDFLGFSNPMLFLLFFMTFPKRKNKLLLLFLGFFSGLILDISSDTSGVFTLSTLVVCFLRDDLLNWILGEISIGKSIRLKGIPFYKRWIYILSFMLIYHTLFYILEFFSFNHSEKLIFNISISTLFSSLICSLVANSME